MRFLVTVFALLLATAAPAAADLLKKPDLAIDGQWSVYLYLPEGPGPHPLVVFFPGCAGWGPWVRVSAEKHREALAEAGWGIAELDVLDAAGHGSICDDVAELEGLRDDAALAASQAAAALAQRPEIDGGRLAFMGQSFGGSVALDLASKHRRKLAAAEPHFAAVVAYYPWCYDYYGMGKMADFDTPVLVLGGALDEWTPVRRCLKLEEAQAARGDATPFVVEVFPDSYHSFDLDDLPRYEIEGFAGTEIVEGNAEQAAKSREVYKAWLGSLP